jgi:flavin reductase (DIM6/NTAB) family NADH-FMN oxidoreductase RutF
MPIDRESFREVLRSWASGVTVVTTRAGDKVHGMTVSAFSSVSADPPLVLVCANQASTTHGVIQEGGLFTVNILASHQAHVSQVFATPDNEDTRLDCVSWSEGETGAPVLDEALACLECTVTNAYREGSHTIYIGRVEAVHRTDAEPLLYYQAGYWKLHAPE